MANIITTDTAIRFKGSSVSKTSLEKVVDLNYGEAGVRVSGPSISIQIFLTDTINGQSFSTVKELRDYVDENFFKGGTGPITDGVQSISGDAVDNTDPQNPIVNQPTWSTIEGKPAFVAEGADQATARASIGAGTSNLELGSDANTAMPGDTPIPTPSTWSTIEGKPEFVAGGATAAAARTALGLGSAATSAASAFATAAQGALAGTALQPGDLDTKVPDGGTNGQVLKKDASGNNVWSTDANTTYAVITETEFNTGTASTARAVSAASLNRDINAKLDLRLSAAQRSAIDALVSPTEDYVDITEATAAIKSIIDALKAT